jgi:3-oxoacyl-(acyl-carrier-protein) synthase/pimeloyl-ACP methyl ester carboxylesterase/acyl carrier protein
MNDDRSRAIAVVGMAGRFPGAPDLDTYWRNVVSGIESVATILEPEAGAAGCDATLPHGSKWIGVASTIEGFEEFDAEYFGMSRMEAEILDPQQRVLLECAVNAFDSAGYDPRSFDGAVGVYVGLGFSTYLADNIGSRADIMETYGRLQLLRGNDRDYGPTRISYYLNLRGPSMAISCACSTSLVAIHQACSSLLSFECDLALAGGSRIDVSANRGYLHQEGGTVSADGHCRPFDARASGTVFGSGAGLVMLRRYEDAVKARDNIHALILGSSVNNDGSDKVGYAAPGIRGQADVIAEALAMAEASSDTIGYVEANGAATQMGDAAEIAALTNAFARKQNGQKKPFCAVGSVKANIGHLDVAAGVAGFIKTVQALKHREMPPCLHFEAANPQIQLGDGPFYINSKPLKWTAGRSPLRAGVSAFGIGGTNAHIVLEEAPPRPPEGSSAGRSVHVLTLSGHKPEALKILRARFAQFLAAPASTPQFSDICATSNVGRAHHRYRMAVVAGKAIAASSLLAEAPSAGEGCLLHGVAKNMPRIRFQMGPLSLEQASRLGAHKDAPEVFRQAWRSCRTSFRGGCARSTIFTAYYAMAATWRAWGISPDEIRGDSVGMLAADCAFARQSLDAVDQLLRELSLDGAETVVTQDTQGAHTVMHLGHRMEVKDASLSQQVEESNHDLPAQFMFGAANLYVLGFEIDWKAVNSDRTYHRVELPAYPFIRKRYWIDRAVPGASPPQTRRGDVRPGYVTPSEIERQLLTWFDDARTRPAEDIDDHHFISDYGIDSLHLLDLLTRVSRHYRIDLTMVELEDVEMIEDLARFVARKVNGSLTPDSKLAASRARAHPVLSRERIERLADNYAHAFAACNGFREHLLERTNGGTTEILDMGRGPPILLLPPLGCIGAAFLYQARYLAQTHRVLTFHYPGYGRSTVSGKEDLRSTVNDIARCLDHLVGRNVCHVIGWSLGGIVGQMFASEYPDLVKSLVLVNTSAKLNGDGSLASIAAMAQLFMDDFAENMPDRMRDRREGQLDFIRASDSAVVSGRFMAAVQAFDGRERLAAITVPTLVVSGGQDRITPAWHGQDLAKRLSRSTYKELATGGHYIPLFNADWFNQQIATFIDAMRS